jgi:hypothetical protein
MSVQIIGVDRPDFVSGDRLRGTAKEVKVAFERCLAYYGTYDVDEKEQTVTHHIRASLFPNNRGAHNRRRYELKGGRLSLITTPEPIGGDQVTAVLRWERVTPVG